MKLTRFALAALASFQLLAGPVEEMSGAAKNFLAALNEEQRGKASFGFEADERENWHFIPKERKGVTLKELEPAQKTLAFGLLSSALSHQGYLKATTIMTLERILQDIEGPKRTFPRDPELYHVSIFGTPDPKGTWGWRFEGHHLSVNLTIVKSAPARAPACVCWAWRRTSAGSSCSRWTRSSAPWPWSKPRHRTTSSRGTSGWPTSVRRRDCRWPS
jgi:hypothetical protein